MRKLILYIAQSLDGKTATPDGRVDWLEQIANPDDNDYGYAEFYDSIDVTLMGNTTYQQIHGFDIPFPYPNKENYVFTRNPEIRENENVQFITGNLISFVRDLKEENGKHIWLVGGSQINKLMYNAGLIDEMILFVMPIILGDGIPLFQPSLLINHPVLISTEQYLSGVVKLHYKFDYKQ